jgi:hypothetical protein
MQQTGSRRLDMIYLKADCRYWREEELSCGRDFRTTCNKCRHYNSKDPLKVPKDFFFRPEDLSRGKITKRRARQMA